MTSDFTTTFRESVRAVGDRPIAEVDGRWYTGHTITGFFDRILGLIVDAGVPDDAVIGLVVRNRLPHAAAIFGFVGLNRSFSMIYSFQSAEAIARDIENLGPAVVVADREDWTPPVIEAARRVGALGIAVALDGEVVELVDGLGKVGPGPFSEVPPEPSLGILTSGTTGAPKRIQIKLPILARSAESAAAGQVVSADDPPDLVFWPFSGIGVAQLLGSGYTGKRFVLLERFDLDAFVSAIKRHRIRMVAVQPTVVRMILEADVPKEDLSSLQFIFGGSAPLEQETMDAFEATYDIPISWAYGATEFAGSLLAWTPALREEFGNTKRGSVGRPMPGTEIRIVNTETGVEVPTGEQGYLEAHIPLIGPDWIRTTDLASVDEDGFVTLHGRGDGAIIRGGFKILPETVQNVLRQHPAVRDVAVVGVADARLGAVPGAAIELVEGADAPTEEEIRDYVRERLPVHHVPTNVVIVDALPRTPSLKVALGQVRELFG